jgi:hypothetical protein
MPSSSDYLNALNATQYNATQYVGSNPKPDLSLVPAGYSLVYSSWTAPAEAAKSYASKGLAGAV